MSSLDAGDETNTSSFFCTKSHVKWPRVNISVFQAGPRLQLPATRRRGRPRWAVPARQPVLWQGPVRRWAALICETAASWGNYRYKWKSCGCVPRQTHGVHVLRPFSKFATGLKKHISSNNTWRLITSFMFLITDTHLHTLNLSNWKSLVLHS